MNAEPDRVSIFRGTPPAKWIATWRLQLDHFSAQVGQDTGAERGRDIMSDFEDFKFQQEVGCS